MPGSDVIISDRELERYIEDDVPTLDLTTHILGIGGLMASIRYETREETVACGVEEAARILGKLGLAVREAVPSGTLLAPGSAILSGEGDAAAVHKAWRVAGSLLEYVSGIATRTRKLVSAARSANPDVAILTTRKVFPGTKRLAIKAILAGGALPHRLGLSETVLVFAEHLRFMGGAAAFAERMRAVRTAAAGKEVCVEVATAEDALPLARAGVDRIQLDKLPPDEAAEAVRRIRAAAPGVKIALAGGINGDNARAYAATGADMLVTTWPYFGKPSDIRTIIAPL